MTTEKKDKKTKAKVAKVKKADVVKSVVQAKHTFTNDELLNLNSQMTDEMTRVNELKDQLGSIQADYKSKIKTAESRVSELHTKLVTRYEMRTTNAIVKFFPKTRMKQLFYENAPKVMIREEPMEPSDFHRDLELNDPKKEPTPAPAGGEMPKAKDGSLGTPVDEVIPA